jgi:hypothetical protein
MGGYFCNFQITAQSKLSPNGRKFADLVTLFIDRASTFHFPFIIFNQCQKNCGFSFLRWIYFGNILTTTLYPDGIRT